MSCYFFFKPACDRGHGIGMKTNYQITPCFFPLLTSCSVCQSSFTGGEREKSSRLQDYIFLLISHCHIWILLDSRHAIIRIITVADSQWNAVQWAAVKSEALHFPFICPNWGQKQPVFKQSRLVYTKQNGPIILWQTHLYCITKCDWNFFKKKNPGVGKSMKT